MTSKRRELLLRVGDGDLQTLYHLFHLDKMRRCDEILDWLIQHGLTGWKLNAWVLFEHEGSLLKAAATAIKWLDGEKGLRPIEAGRDYISTPARPLALVKP